MKKHRLTFTALAMALSSLSYNAIAQTQPAVDEYEAHLKREATLVRSTIISRERGPVHLKGVVVDDQGQPVTGVTLTIDADRVNKDGTDSKIFPLPPREVTGPIDIQEDDVLHVTLTFKSDNYYTRRLQFTPTDGLDRFWWREPKQPGKQAKAGLVRKDLRIVLDKHGPFQKLATMDQGIPKFITYDPAGNCAILDLSHPMDKLLEEVPSVADPSKLPPECIYFTTPLDDQGQVAVQTVKFGPYDHVYPRGMRLVMRGGSGFVTVPIVHEDVWDQYRWMREAPETGYKPEVILDAETLASMLKPKGGEALRYQYFYFKTSRGYGKGRISFTTNDAKPPKAHIDLQLQENGSRNVTTP